MLVDGRELRRGGTSAYAAGNVFLDALAHARRRDGAVAQSIDWGGWAQTGMTTRMDRAQRARHARCGRLLSRRHGAALFETILNDRSAIQVAALRPPSARAGNRAQEPQESDRLLDILERDRRDRESGTTLANWPTLAPGMPLRDQVRALIGRLLDRHLDEVARRVLLA